MEKQKDQTSSPTAVSVEPPGLRPTPLLALSTRGALRLLLLVMGFLVALSTGLSIIAISTGRLGVVRGALFVDDEASLPTWFSQTNLALLAAALAAVGLILRRRPAEPGSTSPDIGRPLAWFVLATVALYLSIDEGAQLHERVNWVFDGTTAPTGALTWWWVIPFGLLVLAVAAAFSRFWWRLPVPTRNGLAIAAGLYVAGAIGMEMVGSEIINGGDGTGRFGGGTGYAYLAATTVEESLEMLGVIIAIYTVLELLRTTVLPNSSTKLELTP